MVEMWMLQVHERTLQGDFLMALLRDLVISRRAAGNPLKVRTAVDCHCHSTNLSYAGLLQCCKQPGCLMPTLSLVLLYSTDVLNTWLVAFHV